MSRVRNAFKNALLAFVLVSIGFAAGKRSARQAVAVQGQLPPDAAAGIEATAGAAAEPVRARETVRVYYLHTTFRCVTCNTIETMTRELLDSAFASELADGRIEWHEVDFQQDEMLAEAFDVAASCVVVATARGGSIVRYRRLDETWTHMKTPTEFNRYVGSAIREALATAGGESAP